MKNATQSHFVTRYELRVARGLGMGFEVHPKPFHPKRETRNPQPLSSHPSTYSTSPYSVNLN